eukprot:CAMPEP_0119320776 /NCGR_PEP_ID=MMETSP1333-20130426/53391_1 /TAXON_ID=418940 /ORGANISM="Scyphosphaera apsteinii, Strain RCC1455" /LENGTH=248 /DNA_ID=CAMNT_0007327571 /DNA_START=235 /DNA_END=981 /DNA_ORIENTATION=-
MVTGKRNELRANRLMYGDRWASIDPAYRARLACTNTQIGSALNHAEGMILVAESGGEAALEKALPYASRLRRIVLLSCIGGSKGGRGNLGEGFDPRTEPVVEQLAANADVELAILRVGILKGGGEAGGVDEDCSSTPCIGLDKAVYYSSLKPGGYESPGSRCARAYDKLTLGAAISLGDSIEPRSAMARSGTRTAHAAYDDEASRINAASALLACLRASSPLSLTLSAAAGRVPPSEAEWDGMLADLA